MVGRWFLFIKDNADFIRCGFRKGYQNLDEAKRDAKKYVDDARPHDKVWVVKLEDYAYFGGNGRNLQSEDD
jgi:hypothetical protein